MQFGAFIPQGWRLDLAGIDAADHWPTMTAVARTAERLGYDSVWVYDHFHTVPVPTQEPTYEAWTLMASLATVTDRVRLGQMCTCNGYRPPAYLAKVAASVDVISGGRVEMGIGGGWYEHEYLAYGYPFPKPSIRLGELDEAVQIMQAMWSDAPTATFHGTHYTVDGAISQPKPLQHGGIPLWIAGGGEQLTLRTAARYARYTNFGGDAIDTFVRKTGVLADHCEREGRDVDTITRSANFNVLLSDSDAGARAKLEATVDRMATVEGVDAERVKRFAAGPGIGTPDQVVELLGTYADAGLGYAIVYFPDAAYDDESITMFAEQVMPALQ